MTPKQVLLIRFSALGDVAMLVPVVRAFAEAFPNVEITILSRKQTESLFVGLPNNVHFFGADLRGRHKGIAGLRRLLSDIDYHRFSDVADMHDVLRSKYLCARFLLAGKRVTIIRKGRWQKKHLVRTHKVDRPLRTTIDRYLAVLARLGYAVQPTPIVTSTEKSGIGIAPFAAHVGKIYPLDKMEQVVQLLSQGKETIYLFGAGSKEKTILDQWESRYPNVVSLVGKHNMSEEMQIMRGLRLMLTMDSANMHLASIVGTRVISIWGATHPAAGFLGYGQQQADCIQRDLPCRPCSIYGNKPCRFGDYRCLDIAPSDIVERVQQIL